MAPPSAPDVAAPWPASRPALVRAGVFAALANGLVLAAPLYSTPLYEWLREDRSGGSLILAAIALALFAAHTLLEFARSRALSQANPPTRIVAGPNVTWLIDAPWIPAHLLVLAGLHPILGAMALAGVAALGALVAVGALSPWDTARQDLPPWSDDPFGPMDAFHTGLRFCGAVYQTLIVGAGAALVLHGTLSPGLFAGAALIAVAAMRTTVRVAVRGRCGQPPPPGRHRHFDRTTGFSGE